ncbi:hypothetical protein VKT23_006320 [Stygiomarasmius scandens]|uniref:BTB domain-containing protein n=1 Tax=Marasmiellus scandens TaxID=2682957 RepID=A0ABR1JN98_9AGAR
MVSPVGSPQVISATIPTDASTICEASDSCSLPVDVILCSSDGVRLGTHRSNLSTYSSSLLPSAVSETGSAELQQFDPTNKYQDIVLPEDSEVIQLLLKFMHHQPQPDLRLISSSLLLRFANAAEKYHIYCATGVCKVVVELSMKEHPFEVFQYASSWGYSGLQELAAKLAMTESPAKFFAYAHSINHVEWRDLAERETHKLTTKQVCDSLKQFCKDSTWPEIFGAWFQKRDALRSALFAPMNNPIPVLHKGGAARCEEWHVFYPHLLGKMAVEPPCEQTFVSILEGLKPILKDCAHCGIVLKTMKERVHSGLESISKKPLAEFLEH